MVSGVIALVLLVGTLGFGLTMIASVEEENGGDDSDQAASLNVQ